jgi:hypothetical protein
MTAAASSWANDASDAIVRRAEARLARQVDLVHRRTDRLFAYLLGAEWIAGIAVALAFSPWAWEGKVRTVHAHVWAAVALGGLIVSLPIALALLRPGRVLTRHVVAAGQMLWAALLIHLLGGRIETHFHIFGSLAFLSFYRDPKVLVTGAAVVAVEHFVRQMAWPESVYGIVNPEWWRFLEHAWWVVFECAFLTWACVTGMREMRVLAESGAMIEALAESEWKESSVLERGVPAASDAR